MNAYKHASLTPVALTTVSVLFAFAVVWVPSAAHAADLDLGDFISPSYIDSYTSYNDYISPSYIDSYTPYNDYISPSYIDSYSPSYDYGYSGGSSFGFSGGWSYPVSSFGGTGGGYSSTNVFAPTNTCTATNSCNTTTQINAPTSIVNNTSGGGYPYPVYQPVYNTPVYYPQQQYYPPQQPMYRQPYVTLAAAPYTGLDLGPWGTAAYWGFLILWCLAAAYLIAVKKVQNKIVAWFVSPQNPVAQKSSGSPQTFVRQDSAPSVPVATQSGIDPFIIAQINRA